MRVVQCAVHNKEVVKMKVYTCKFPGIYVQGAAMVIAKDAEHAAELLNRELEQRAGIEFRATVFDMEQRSITVENVVVISDGDY